jgi:hypothetical protein
LSPRSAAGSRGPQPLYQQSLRDEFDLERRRADRLRRARHAAGTGGERGDELAHLTAGNQRDRMGRLTAERIGHHDQVARPGVPHRGNKVHRESVDDAETR